MNLPLTVVLFCALPCLIFAALSDDSQIDCNNNRNSSDVALIRRKRYLDFLKGSRVFFRVNFKVNVLPVGAIWAFAAGWKATMNILNDKGTRPFRRDTYQVMRELMDLHGFDGEACMLKAFCMATRDGDGSYSNGILYKLLRHVFTVVVPDRNNMIATVLNKTGMPVLQFQYYLYTHIEGNVFQIVREKGVNLNNIQIVYTVTSCNDTRTSGHGTQSRERRHLDFIKASRVFFRANIKSTVLSIGSLWQTAIGFKANIPILNENKSVRPFRRDTAEVLQDLLDMHGFDGQACLLKAFCLAKRSIGEPQTNGILFKLLRHIFNLNEHDRKHFPYLKDEHCEQFLPHHCPLSFNNVSPYTDDI